MNAFQAATILTPTGYGDLTGLATTDEDSEATVEAVLRLPSDVLEFGSNAFAALL